MVQPTQKDPTEQEFVYVLIGNPVPLARARIGSRCLYDGQKQLKLMMGIELSKQHGFRDLLSGPILLDISFYFPMPKSSRKHHDKILGTPHHYKPDISNLIKFYEDIANKILFDDDCLIASIIAKKVYDYNPRTVMKLRRIDGRL